MDIGKIIEIKQLPKPEVIVLPPVKKPLEIKQPVPAK